MGRSRESVRENKAMQSILRGETPEKRIFVSTVDKEFQEKMKLERNIKKQLWNFRKYIEKNCKNVGENFTREARSIHYDKKTSQGIINKIVG